MRTTFGKNLRNIEDSVDVELSMLSCTKLKNTMKYYKTPDDQVWRVALLKDLLELKWNTVEIELINEGIDDLDTMIGTLCVM